MKSSGNAEVLLPVRNPQFRFIGNPSYGKNADNNRVLEPRFGNLQNLSASVILTHSIHNLPQGRYNTRFSYLEGCPDDKRTRQET